MLDLCATFIAVLVHRDVPAFVVAAAAEANVRLKSINACTKPTGQWQRLL